MASPAETRGRNRPDACLIRIAPALSPAVCLIVPSSAADTVRSAVTTTRSDLVSTYQAMPSTWDRCTARLAAASWLGLNCWVPEVDASATEAAGASDEKATTKPRLAASRPVALTARRRGCLRCAVMG